MVLLNSATLETTKLVPSSVQLINWADFGSMIILGHDSQNPWCYAEERGLLVELGDKVVGGDRLPAERATLRYGFQRVLLAATVAPTIGRTSGDGVSVGHVHFIVNGAVHVTGLVEVVLQHGPIGGEAALSGDRLLVRGGRTRAV